MRTSSQGRLGHLETRWRNHFISHTLRRREFIAGVARLGLFAAVLPITGCALSSPPHNPPPPPVTVSLSPGTDALFLGQTLQFTATVTNAANVSVNWSVNGIPGGNSVVGTITPSSNGADTATFTAPQILPTPATATISVVSQADPSASATASVMIQSDVSVSISPASATLATNASQSFAAKVTGSGNPSLAVTWAANGISGGNSSVGTVVSTGADTATYTAPLVPPSPLGVSVTAVSVADPSRSAVASVTITCPSSGSLSPPTASIKTGSSQIFTASLCVLPGAAFTWDVNGLAGGNSTIGTIAPSVSNPSVATYTAPATVPVPSAVTIHAISGGQSASASVTIAAPPPITIMVSPPSASVSVGQRVSFAATVTGTTNLAVTWAVNGVVNGNSTFGEVCAPSSNPCTPPTGNETDVDFLAPSSPPQPSTMTLTASSVASVTSTGSAQITIPPLPQVNVSIAPFYTFLDPSQQFQFSATVSGSADQSVTWNVASAVPGQGCSGSSCGAIDGSGNYTAPGVAPSPNAISIIATSVANPSASATATVALLSGPIIETILPSSVIAGVPNSFLFAVQGLNFVPTTSSASSQFLINGSPRTTNCPTSGRCTITFLPTDVATAGVISVQVENPGAVPALSNPVSLVILTSEISPGVIALTSLSPLATGENIVVTEPTTAGATPSPVNVDFAGPMSADGSTCTLQGSPIIVTRPTSGTETLNICVHGNYLDPSFSYGFTSPSTGGDIGVVPSAISGLLPNLIELSLTLSSNTVTGVRSLFVTTPNGDVALATGLIEVK